MPPSCTVHSGISSGAAAAIPAIAARNRTEAESDRRCIVADEVMRQPASVRKPNPPRAIRRRTYPRRVQRLLPPPSTLCPGSVTMLASQILRRNIARAPSAAARRFISRSPATAAAEPTSTPGGRPGFAPSGRSVFDTHTVEELQGMSARDILHETGSRKDSQMRHFTGVFIPAFAGLLLY